MSAKRKPNPTATVIDSTELDGYAGVQGATWTNQRAAVMVPDPSCGVCHGTGWEPKEPWVLAKAPTACFRERQCRKCRKVEKR